MDKSFHSPLMARSPFSPRGRQGITSKRSLLPGFCTPSRITSSVKSGQSVQVILKSAHNFVERFGQSLPVLITEAITFADRNAVVSARISECGYAWVVCGRRLLIWQYRQNVGFTGTPQKKMMVSSQCFELHLPQSDLAHRAELVSVFISSASHTPSCIAVSPEGVVRYWPSVIHDGVSVEQIADLQGQECDSLTDIGGLGSILATTTCSVVWIQPHLSAGRPSLICHNLRTPTGWLGGITKKMSSFIFGPLSTEQNAETRLVRVLTVQENENSWLVYVLAGHSLQKWRLSANKEELLIFIVELNQLIRDGFRSTIWEQTGGDPSEIDTWLLDIQSDKGNVIILAAAVNMHISPQVHYAMISVQTNLPTPPTNIRDLLLLKMNGLYREDNSSDSLSYRFLLCGTCAYLYNQRTITIFKPQEEPDILEFHGLPDFILGGAVCVNTPIFFLRNHGLVTISHNDAGTDFNISTSIANVESLNDSGLGNLSVYNMDAEEIYNTYKTTISKMKAAFIYHLKKQKSACQDIIHEIFVPEPSFTCTINSTLDKCVVGICRELLDDTPAGDPRWSHKTRVGIGSSYAMQVLHQLQDKQKALNLFVRFLHEFELWNYLGAVTIHDTILATAYVLGEFFEKIIAGITLKQHSHSSVLTKAIDNYITDSEVPKEHGLTKQDILFSKVTQIHQILQELVNRCDEAAHSDLNPMEAIELVKETNNIILSVLKDINQFRYQNKDNYTPQDGALAIAPAFLPWTSAVGASGLHDSLMLQQSVTYNYGAKIASDNNTRIILYDQLTSLIDFILDGYKTHLDSIKGTHRENILTKQYQSDRHKLISPLIIEKEFERATLLAEKYLDFETLIVICDATQNQQKLRNYMDRYNSQGFSEFLYTWYLQENQPGKIIDICKTSQVNPQLTTFLADHPSLLWIQNIYENKFSGAANILKNLASNETDLIVRQKTMFSLSKLAKLTTDEDDTNDYVDFIDSRLELISIQEEIPDYVLQSYGYDTINIKVIPPKDLIYLYTCVEYKEAGDIEFKKALDLLQYIDDNEVRSEQLLNIWKAAILRDSWLEGNLDSPIEVLQNTLFFKLADLAFRLGGDPYDFLPPLEALTDVLELSVVQDNKHFQFLMKTAYEYFYGLKS
ncbi:hypothetical protein RN001_000285 [Aquatica leii]|uniref:Nuclear pore complex protein Nup133 n=1 Tax=Aquatica leii TaxID=1421715 RepID=A0AAN7Q2T8_9COLE|nr:hypothetical protein RN001_000285 [Aquatica leii]